MKTSPNFFKLLDAIRLFKSKFTGHDEFKQIIKQLDRYTMSLYGPDKTFSSRDEYQTFASPDEWDDFMGAFADQIEHLSKMSLSDIRQPSGQIYLRFIQEGIYVGQINAPDKKPNGFRN
jgi:hypothetical protein